MIPFALNLRCDLIVGVAFGNDELLPLLPELPDLLVDLLTDLLELPDLLDDLLIDLLELLDFDAELLLDTLTLDIEDIAFDGLLTLENDSDGFVRLCE